jgi:hypothetical protein
MRGGNEAYKSSAPSRDTFAFAHRIRLVHTWAGSIGPGPAAYGTQSMRRTKPTLIYWRMRNIRAVKLLLGHTKLERMVGYLGMEVDDALERGVVL